MPDITTKPEPLGKVPRRSLLVPVGVALDAMGLIDSQLCQSAALHTGEDLVRSLLLIATDVFRVGFFAGIAAYYRYPSQPALET